LCTPRSGSPAGGSTWTSSRWSKIRAIPNESIYDRDGRLPAEVWKYRVATVETMLLANSARHPSAT
jgi:hypothetical protein